MKFHLPKFPNYQTVFTQASFMRFIGPTRLVIPALISGIIGVGTGITVVVFVKSIEFSEHFFFDFLPHVSPFPAHYTLFFIPALGGLIVGLMAQTFSAEPVTHGVAEVIKTIAVRRGKIPPHWLILKAIASSISIGSGASVGREGPAVTIGAAFASLVARIFHMKEMQVKNLIACGAAAGIAAVFNAPIAGVMFSLEVILRDFGARAMSTVVIAAVASSIIGHVFLGAHPAFFAPTYVLESPLEIILYLLLGIVSAFIGLLFIDSLDKVEIFFSKTPLYRWVKPAVGGLLVGAIGFFFPEVLGQGLESIENILAGNVEIKLLCALLLFKLLATSISLGSGSSGGTFAPTLFVGAAAGGVFGKLFQNIFPFAVAPSGAYALVGMASVFAAATHAPVTAILLVFELTGDYRMILPIMIAVVTSTSIAQFIRNESIETIKLKREGIEPDSLEESKLLSAMQVRDAMSEKFETVRRSESCAPIIRRLSLEKDITFFVINRRDELVGIIEPEVAQEVLFEDKVDGIIVDDIASPISETVCPGDPLNEAARFMVAHSLKHIPVVDPSIPTKVIGVLSANDFFRAYTDLTLKRTELVDRLEKAGDQALGTVLHCLSLPTYCSINKVNLKDLDLPMGVVFTSIQRKGKSLIPKGETTLQAKDKIWAAVLKQNEPAFLEWVEAKRLRRFFH